MIGKKLRSPIILFLAGLSFLVSVYFGINQTRFWILVKDANSTGMDWAHHLEQRIPSLRGMKNADGTVNIHGIPDAKQFGDLVSDVLAVGNIYQVDFINSHCFCELSLGSYQDRKVYGQSDAVLKDSNGQAHGHGHSHATHKNDFGSHSQIETPSTDVLRHVFINRQIHGPMMPPGDRKFQFPVDRKMAQSIVREREHKIFIRSDHVAHQPATFAEVYHPVIANGEIAYVLRVLVNLEEKAARYTTILYSGAAIILLLLVLAFGYPAIGYVKSLRKERAADWRSHYLAHHDALTKTYNRNGLEQFSPSLLESCRLNDKSALLFLFDLNDFKEINDYHGSLVGDQLLRAFANLLRQSVPEGSIIARLGGDEFVVILRGIERGEINHEDILNIPNSVEIEINEGGQVLKASFAGGVATYPRDGRSVSEMLRSANLALQAAKSDNEGFVLEYDPQMGIDFEHRIELREEFREALKLSQVEPYYQPLVNMNTGQVEGFEALARWKHPERGLLTPYVFQEMLDDHELGAMVGSQMFHKIVRDMAQWKADNVPFESVGLNVGDGDLLNPGFALEIVAELAKHGLSGNNLAIEVTENCLFGSNKKAFIGQLEHLRSIGCYVALDDFGTGYSSITQIKELPITAVKIDESFVNEVINDTADQAIIAALQTLGKTMGFRLVLEGIETEEQRNFLRAVGSELAQGYFYSRPMPASKVPEFIKQQNAVSNHEVAGAWVA